MLIWFTNFLRKFKMKNIPEIKSEVVFAAGDVMIDSRDKSYFVITAVNDEKWLAMGYRYSNEDNYSRDRLKEGDIISYSSLKLNYTKKV